MTDPGQSEELLRNDSVAVTHWTLPPGSATGLHAHRFDYVVIPLSDGELRATNSDGSTTVVPLRELSPYFRSAGAIHDVACGGKQLVSFVEVELIGGNGSPSAGTSSAGPSVDATAAK